MAKSRFEVTTIGEMLIRLSVPCGKRIENATQLEVFPAGAEAHVVTLLARLEKQTCWFGALPRDPLGRLDGDLSAGLRYGITPSALSLTQFGDMVVSNKSELQALRQGSATLTR